MTGLMQRSVQRRLENFQNWYNEHGAHSALHGLTPVEVWEGQCLPEPIPIRSRDAAGPQIDIRCLHYRGDPLLPVIHITLRRAA